MLPDEFLFFLFLLCLLIDEFLIDVDVLISYMLRYGFNFCRFLDQLLLHILHEEGWSSLRVIRVASWKWVWSSKNTATIAGHARGVEPAVRRCHKLLVRRCIPAIVINVIHGYGVFPNQATAHDKSSVLLVVCTRHWMLYPMLLEVVPNLISLILKPLSGGLADVVRVLSAATCRLSLHLLLL